MYLQQFSHLGTQVVTLVLKTTKFPFIFSLQHGIVQAGLYSRSFISLRTVLGDLQGRRSKWAYREPGISGSNLTRLVSGFAGSTHLQIYPRGIDVQGAH